MLTTAQLASQTTFAALSAFFERAGYYGTRTIIFLYVINKEDASFMFVFFTVAFSIARPIGGIITDLITGVKLSTIIGLSAMALGCFSLIFDHLISPYAGICIMAFGNGLFLPANMVHMLRIYEGRESKTDGGLSIQYTMINLGSLIGPLFMALIVGIDSFEIGFVCLGILLICGLIVTLLYKEQPVRSLPKRKHSFSRGFRSFAIIGIVVGCMVYWFAHTVSSNHLRSSLQPGFDYWATLIPELIGLFICILFSLLWYFVDLRSAWKWTFGAFITAIGILLCLLFNESSTPAISLFLIASSFLGLGEILFATYWYSIVKRFANPKYLCSIIGCVMGISSYGSYFLASSFDEKYHNEFLASFLGMVGLILLAVMSLILTLVFKKQEPDSKSDEYAIADNSLIDQ